MPHHINNDCKDFRDWYFEVCGNPENNLKIEEPFHRPSIMAHSLGTWMLVQTLRKFPEVKFDKIFLFGSIIPYDFDWFDLILRDQVNTVVYEKASRDWIVPLGCVFTRSFRSCSSHGFLQQSSFIKEETLSLFGHSDFDYKAHFSKYLKKWLPQTPHQLAAVNGRELRKKDVKRFFTETAKIDRGVYPEEYVLQEITLEKALDWFDGEKDIWSFVINAYKQKPIGYINAVPVNNEIYEKFCRGEINEHELASSDILDYDRCSQYNLIVLSIAINQSLTDEETTLTRGRIAEMLVMSFVYKLHRHDKGRRRVMRMAAYAWTNQGKHLCNGFCMQLKGEVGGHHLYEIDLRNLNQFNEANLMAKWWFTKMLKYNG